MGNIEWNITPLFLRLLEKQVLKKYREIPVDILEDSKHLLFWAKKASA
jgi:hypothetical protein